MLSIRAITVNTTKIVGISFTKLHLSIIGPNRNRTGASPQVFIISATQGHDSYGPDIMFSA